MKTTILKRTAIILAAATIAMVMAIMLAACGNNENGGTASNPHPAEFVGYYVFVNSTADQLSESGEVLYHNELHLGDPDDSTPEGGVITETYSTVTLNADGTGIYKMPVFGNQNITWAADGNNISITIPGQSVHFTYDNGVLHATAEVNYNTNTMRETITFRKLGN